MGSAAANETFQVVQDIPIHLIRISAETGNTDDDVVKDSLRRY